MNRLVIAATLLAAAAGCAQAGTRAYTDADRAFYADDAARPSKAEPPRRQDGDRGFDDHGFGSFSAANTAKTLGY